MATLKHVHIDGLYEFIELGCGIILNVLSAREPVGTPPDDDREILVKSSYVIDVLIGERVHRINLSVHWYWPDGAPQGWWSHREEQRRLGDKRGWYGVNWL